MNHVEDRAPSPKLLPKNICDQLGAYVYALLDPRDRSIFYVGAGRGNRIFTLVWTALGETSKLTEAGEKTPLATPETEAALRRIRTVYESGYAVEHFIVADALNPKTDADHTAAVTAEAVIAALGLTEPHRGECVLTNLAGATEESEADRAAIPIAELVRQYSASPAPELPTPCVVLRVNEAKKRRRRRCANSRPSRGRPGRSAWDRRSADHRRRRQHRPGGLSRHRVGSGRSHGGERRHDPLPVRRGGRRRARGKVRQHSRHAGPAGSQALAVARLGSASDACSAAAGRAPEGTAP